MIKLPTPTLYLRSDKRKKNGRMPLYIRFPRIDGEEPKYPMGIDLLPEEWDDKTKEPIDDALKLIIEKELTRIRTRIYNVLVNGEKLTKTCLREIVANEEPKDPGDASFYEYFDKYVLERRQAGKMTRSTEKGYDTTRRALKEFREKIRIKDIDAKFINDFERFLVKRGREHGLGDVLGTRANRLKHVRTIVLDIERRGIPIKNPYRTRECEVPKAAENDTFLEYDELKRMYQLLGLDAEIGSTEFRVLVMFLFSCAVGIRLSDALCITWGALDVTQETIIVHLIPKKGDKPWKRNREVHIPLSTFGERMIEWIAADDDGIPFSQVERENRMFRISSASTVNPTLKKLAKMAGIDKNLTYHASRRTFATLTASEGADTYTIKNYLGHSSVTMSERYMKWSKQLALESAEKNHLIDIKKIVHRTKKKK